LHGFSSVKKLWAFKAAFPGRVFGKRDRRATGPRLDRALKAPLTSSASRLYRWDGEDNPMPFSLNVNVLHIDPAPDV
jgi:hypothetical protein